MIDIASRFWAKVAKTESCWLWTAGTSIGGYGEFHVSGRGRDRVRLYAHRWAYEELVGPIPGGLELDHLCRVRNCVNPAHLEPVTHAENHRRRRGFSHGPYDVGTHCKSGHPRDAENTGVNKQGNRFCRACARDAQRRHRLKKSIS